MEIDKIKPSSAFSAMGIVLQFFTIEFMIFLLKRELFLSQDVIGLVVIGIGLLAPYSISMTLLYAAFRRANGKPKSEPLTMEYSEYLAKSLYSGGSIFSISIVSFWTLISYTLKFSLVSCIWLTFVTVLVLFFVAWLFSKVGNSGP